MEASTRRKKNMLGRIMGVAALAVIGIILIFIVLDLPKLENFFLRKGLEYAREKTLAVLPTLEGYNPDLHPVDPLQIRSSLTFLRESLAIDSLATQYFQADVKHFMTTFKNTYNDQAISIDEAVLIAGALDTLQRNFLKNNFIQTQNFLSREFEKNRQVDAGHYREILGFDSLSIFNEQIQLGLSGPYSVNLVNLCRQAMADKTISAEENEWILTALHNIDRFQLRNEFMGATRLVFDSPEFKEFPEAGQFRENVRIILNRLRDLNYNYDEIKPTLRSFIFLWYQHAGSVRDIPFDLRSLYEFSNYAAAHAQKP